MGRIADFRPLTFLERGVAVSFTTPLLLGTRARPAAHGGGVELLIPNPAGSRGYYVTPWSGISDLCTPTVHDRLLIEQVCALPAITPRAIGQVVREIAEIGTAGHAARDAARRAAKIDHDTHLLVNFNLLMALVRQVAPETIGRQEAGDYSRVEENARICMARLAPRLQCPANVVADHLEAIASLYIPLGIVDSDVGSRMRRALRALEVLCRDTRAWAESHDGESADAAFMISDVAQLTVACAERTMAAARASTEDLPVLLARWINDPDVVRGETTRTEWLLDGWDQISLIWQMAETSQDRYRALVEIAPMVPVVPKEAMEWVEIAETRQPPRRRQVRLDEDWRTGNQVFGQLVDRNERLIAMALGC